MKDRYQGIDCFRLIAALMVVAIHTFPFSSLSPQLDELITLTFFRVAVPFFFMTTGYFLIGPYADNTSFYHEKKIGIFLKKIVIIYIIMIIIYLPFSFFNGTITKNITLIKMLQLLVFDGTFYHLWYFPGVIIGTLLISLLLKILKFDYVLALSGVLYLIGLLGDSWYGVIKSIPILFQFYEGVFQLAEFTRNGLFFTPLFLCLGVLTYRQRNRLNKNSQEINLFLGITTIMLLVESFFLHQLFTIRHDSMYLLLPVVMYYLFSFLLTWQPKIQIKEVQQLSLLIYIIHPLVIVVIHFVSNKVPFIKFSLLYYVLVVVGSLISSMFIMSWQKRLKKENRNLNTYRAEREISQHAVSHNIKEIQQIIPKKTKIIAVVKANAYGADMIEYSKLLLKNKIDFFAVATIDEAITLRKALITGDILILGYTDIKRSKELKKYDLIQSVGSEEYGKILDRQKQALRCHLQIDTGMHRLGMNPDVGVVANMYQLKNLQIEGIYSHLGSSDTLEEKAVARTEQQLQVYCHLLNKLKQRNINYGVTHIQSSYGILNYSEYQFDYVRAGVMLYGFLSNDEPVKEQVTLKPAVRIKAKLISKRWVKAGEYLGYGTDTVLEKETLVGIISIGYGDGLPRSLSNSGFGVEYQDYFLPQIGRICMDMLLVDLSQVERIPIDEEVIVLSDLKKIATMNNTITNETLSQLGQRLSTSIS